jgi:hypothetical protein
MRFYLGSPLKSHQSKSLPLARGNCHRPNYLLNPAHQADEYQSFTKLRVGEQFWWLFASWFRVKAVASELLRLLRIRGGTTEILDEDNLVLCLIVEQFVSHRPSHSNAESSWTDAQLLTDGRVRNGFVRRLTDSSVG